MGQSGVGGGILGVSEGFRDKSHCAGGDVRGLGAKRANGFHVGAIP